MYSFSLKLCHRFNNREQDFKLSNSASYDTRVLQISLPLRGRPIFFNHSNDFRPNWIPLESITIIYHNHYDFLKCDWCISFFIFTDHPRL